MLRCHMTGGILLTHPVCIISLNDKVAHQELSSNSHVDLPSFAYANCERQYVHSQPQGDLKTFNFDNLTC